MIHIAEIKKQRAFEELSGKFQKGPRTQRKQVDAPGMGRDRGSGQNTENWMKMCVKEGIYQRNNMRKSTEINSLNKSEQVRGSRLHTFL